MTVNAYVTARAIGAVEDLNNEEAIAAVAQQTDLGAESYVPTLASSGAGVLALVGSFQALYIKDSLGRTVVHVQGTFHFTRAAAGVAETITMTLPPGAQPVANFAAAGDAIGSAKLSGLHAATDFCSTLQATAGAKKVQTEITDNAASSDVEVRFAYRTS